MAVFFFEIEILIRTSGLLPYTTVKKYLSHGDNKKLKPEFSMTRNMVWYHDDLGSSMMQGFRAWALNAV